jgi:type III protein arginine methyltransferase
MQKLAALEALAQAAEGNAMAMALLADGFLNLGEGARAREISAKALALAPGDGEIAEIAARIAVADVPKWHFSIIRDERRNAAYDAALRRTVKPGAKVLEIGTGSGILAMMAARAGAGEVVSCEANAAVAAQAAKIVALNGYADRVRIIVKHSKNLSLESDLHGPADVLVSEIVSADLLGEDVLAVMQDVVPRLLKPGAAVIPAQGSIRIALAEDGEDGNRRMGMVDGFDLSPFNCLAKTKYMTLGGRLTQRSEAADLFRFDFAGGGPFEALRTNCTLTAGGGRVTGIVQWISLGLDGQGTYENRPEDKRYSCWGKFVYPFRRPLELRAGERVAVHGRHDGKKLYLWIGPPVP